jgi:hypothetical protein
MGIIGIGLVGVIHLFVGVDMLMTRQTGMAVVFFAYAVSAVGFIIAAYQGATTH